MVKKLMKYEAMAYSRVMLPMLGILLGASVLTRFIQFFENDTTVYSLLFGSSVFFYVISAIVCTVMAVFMGVTRYYKNMFTREGYLTLTLPVTPTQHIFVKLLVAVLFIVATVVAVIASVCVVTAGDALIELVIAIIFILKKYFAAFGAGHGTLYLLELAVILIISGASEQLKFYACISLGQTAKKNRILAAFGFYFGYYFLCQVLGTVLIVIVMVLSESFSLYWIGEFITNHPFAAAHLAMLGFIVFYSLTSWLYFTVCRYILKNSLNVE